MEQLSLWGASSPVARRSIPLLSKSRFAAGLQCFKRLYLECFHRDRMDPVDPARQALFDSGQRVGRVAQGRFPGGVLIREDHLHHDDAVRSTAAAIADADVRAVYEAAFLFDGIRVRVDVLSRAGRDGWDLVEVKSAASVKDEHLPDLAVQLYVVEGSGIPVRSASLLHINSGYRFEGGPYDLEALFRRVDRTAAARAARDGIRGQLEAMRAPLYVATPPDIPIGSHCERPYRCPFYAHCHDGGPQHPCHELPHRSDRLLRALEEASIRDIGEIPPDFSGLNAIQRRVRDCVAGGRVHADPELREKLRSLTGPVHFLDFETMSPALPILPGTRPFDQIPIQWSAHVLDGAGALAHREYLHDAPGDPRPALAETLVRALGEDGSIVVYSGFEERIIRSLSKDVPRLSQRLALLAPRIADLHDLIKTHYYHPEFHGSFSIKHVLPVLVDGLDYSDLAIRDGSVAGSAYVEMMDSETPQGRRDEIRDSLRAYCKRDTEAMVRLYLALKEAA